MNKSDLSPDQHEAYSGILTWLNRGTETKQTLTLAGFAGCGKTTVVSVLANELPQPLAFCAFTGKASSVLGRTLRSQGIETTPKLPNFDGHGQRVYESRPYCGTIHGLIYRPCDWCMPKEVAHGHDGQGNCRRTEHELSQGEVPSTHCLEHGHPRGRCPDCDRCPGCEPPPMRPRTKGSCGNCKTFRFTRRDKLDRDYKLIVADEASMISDDMLAALLQYDIPILAVGDHGQLNPVRGSGSLMLKPDIRLEKIHRQAENNPIIALSKFVRETGTIHPRFCDGKHIWMDQVRNLDAFIGKSFAPGRTDLLSSVFICGTNKKRVEVNHTVRRALGVEGPPQKGDVVICIKNKPPIYNGMRGVITSNVDYEDDEKRPKYLAQVDYPEDGVIDDAEMSGHQFYLPKPSPIDWDWASDHGITPLASLGDLYDYGYALTCHKMQGSQAEKVAVRLDDIGWMAPDEQTRWKYTSVTRAQKMLVLFS